MKSQLFSKVLLVALMIVGLNVQAADGTMKSNYVAAIASDQATNVVMAYAFAKNAQASGHPTTVILGSNSIKFALKDTYQDVIAPLGKTPRGLLLELIERGVSVQVCALCLKVFDIDKSEIISGTGFINGKIASQIVLLPNTQVMTF